MACSAKVGVSKDLHEEGRAVHFDDAVSMEVGFF